MYIHVNSKVHNSQLKFGMLDEIIMETDSFRHLLAALAKRIAVLGSSHLPTSGWNLPEPHGKTCEQQQVR